MPSPFLFLIGIFSLFSFSFAQYGSEEWLHPATNILTPKDTSSFLQLYNNSHIGLINFNDSLTFLTKKLGFKYVKKFENGGIQFYYNEYKSITKSIEKDYSFSIQNIYNEVFFGYKIKKNIITADIGVKKYSGINEFVPSILFSSNLRPGILFRFGKSIRKVPFEFRFNYKEFVYNPNDIYTDHEIYRYGINFSGKNYSVDYMMEDDKWKINSNDSSFSAIDLDNGIKSNILINGVIYLNNDSKINCVYNNKRASQTKLNLNNSSNVYFFKVNNYTNDNYLLLLNYQFLKSNSRINLTLLQQGVDFRLSDRIRPYAVSTNLESFFNSAFFIVNSDIGELIQRMISIKIEPKELSTFSPYYQLDWLKDKYYINLNTGGFTLFGIPVYINNQDLNIIGKEAINLRFGFKMLKNNWLFSASFSQHIPYKIDLKEKITPKEEKEAKEDIYGGGLFQFSITKYLD